MRPRFVSILMALPMLALLTQPARAVGLRDVIDALESPFQKQQIKDYSADFFQESRIASLDRLQRARGQVSVRFNYRSGHVPMVMFHWEYQEPTRQEIVSDGKTLWVYLPENNQVIQSDIEMVSQARDNDSMTFLTGLGNLSRDFQISYAEPNLDPRGNYILNLRPKRTTALISRMVIVVDRDAVLGSSAGTGTPDETSSARETSARPSRNSKLRQADTGASDTAARRQSSFFDDKFDPKQQITESRSDNAQAGTFPEEPSGFASSSGGRRQRGGPVFPILSTTVYDPNGNSTTIEFSDVRVNVGIPAGTFHFLLPPGVEVVRPTGKEMGL